MSSLPYWIIALYVFIIGLCIGSFLNVVILRGLSGESFVFSRSKCPKCSKQLKWYMNIPLLSYIFLRGKCAYCSQTISIQYPLVEFICALCFLGVFIAFGLTFKTLFLWIIFSIFIALFVTDLKQTVIIDYHAYALLIAALLYSFFGFGGVSILQAIIGAIAGFLIFEIMARAGKLIVGYRMFGEGDSLIALGLGAIFGIKSLVLVIALSILIQGVSALPLLIKKAYLSNNKKLALSYVFTFFAIIAAFFLNKINFLFSLIISILLLWALKNIIFELKNKTVENYEQACASLCVMPFGPAMIIASGVCIFYLAPIKKFVLDYLFCLY